MIKNIEVSIKGVSALLMHAFPMNELEKGWEKWPPDKQAEICLYLNNQGKIYIPGIAVQRCLVGAAAYSKGKGRASLQKQVAACVVVSPEYCIIHPQDYVVDSRPIVVPATKGRVIRHRPKFETWEISFSVVYDTALISEKELRQVVDDAGSRVGLLDFRPEKKGPFGKFIVTKWQ